MSGTVSRHREGSLDAVWTVPALSLAFGSATDAPALMSRGVLVDGRCEGMARGGIDIPGGGLPKRALIRMNRVFHFLLTHIPHGGQNTKMPRLIMADPACRPGGSPLKWRSCFAEDVSDCERDDMSDGG